MIELKLVATAIGIILAWWILSGIYERLQIKAPTHRIIKILLDESHFVYHRTEEKDSGKYSVQKYMLRHVPSGHKTYIHRNMFSDYWYLTGDLSWMNQYEQARIAEIVHAGQLRRDKNHSDACKIEKAARDERSREKAKEKY